jgi:hypothetical protein
LKNNVETITFSSKLMETFILTKIYQKNARKLRGLSYEVTDKIKRRSSDEDNELNDK